MRYGEQWLFVYVEWCDYRATRSAWFFCDNVLIRTSYILLLWGYLNVSDDFFVVTGVLILLFRPKRVLPYPFLSLTILVIRHRVCLSLTKIYAGSASPVGDSEWLNATFILETSFMSSNLTLLIRYLDTTRPACIQIAVLPYTRVSLTWLRLVANVKSYARIRWLCRTALSHLPARALTGTGSLDQWWILFDDWALL